MEGIFIILLFTNEKLPMIKGGITNIYRGEKSETNKNFIFHDMYIL